MRRKKEVRLTLFKLAVAFVGALGFAYAAGAETQNLLNASYDPTRELWKELNAAFVPQYKAKTGVDLSDQDVARRLGHAGPRGDRRSRGRRRDARDVASDTDAIVKAGLIDAELARAAAERRQRRTTSRSCSSCARATRRASRTGPT